MKEKTKAFYKAVFKYWLHERKESVKRLSNKGNSAAEAAGKRGNAD